MLLAVVPPIAYFFIRLLALTCKKRYHIPKRIPKAPFLVAFWHGEILMNPLMYKKILKDVRMSLMISDHFDGEMIARSVSFFGFDTIRGSSTRGGIKALKESFKKIDQGNAIAITPDGPKGPRHSVADGIVVIAQKKELEIVVFNYKASSFWQMKSWDQFIVPKPFSTLDFYASEPFSVTHLSRDDAKAEIKRRLQAYV
ncbi:MAG: lysophospholipid acyltransferase family protein [Epsilonproteobacteria bacterium]|nr:lysophospholipid acyltransferase family protein [Campylobacterota bacterium]